MRKIGGITWLKKRWMTNLGYYGSVSPRLYRKIDYYLVDYIDEQMLPIIWEMIDVFIRENTKLFVKGK
jgi:hypothetical protein